MAGYGHKIIYIYVRQKYADKILSWFNAHLKIRTFKMIVRFLMFLNFSKIYVHMVFCHQNYSDLLWEKIVLVIEKKTEDWDFAKVLKSLEKVVQTVKGQNNFW